MRSLAAIAVALMLSACSGLPVIASFGPIEGDSSFVYEGPKFVDAFASAYPKNEAPAEHVFGAVWIPNVVGYEDFRVSRNALFTKPMAPTKLGVMALSRDAVVFLQWLDGRYVPIKRIARDAISSAEVEEWSFGRRIIVRTRDYATDTFEAALRLDNNRTTFKTPEDVAAEIGAAKR